MKISKELILKIKQRRLRAITFMGSNREKSNIAFFGAPLIFSPITNTPSLKKISPLNKTIIKKGRVWVLNRNGLIPMFREMV
jgi:hypothetical protein